MVTPSANQLASLPSAPVPPGGGLDAIYPPVPLPEEFTVVPDVPTAAAPAPMLSLDQVLAPYVIIFCIAFGVAYLFTPLMRKVALSFDIVDRPDSGTAGGGRKLHRRPVAYLGGVAIFLGFICSLSLGQFVSQNHREGIDQMLRVPLPVVAGAFVIVGLGLIDDTKGIRPFMKILGQVAAAVCLLSFGIGDDILDQFTRYSFEWLDLETGLRVPAAVESGIGAILSCAFVIALVVFCCNASNLMDGMDGLCSGITAVIAVGLVAVAAHLAMTGPLGRAPADAARVAIAMALLGATLGFLPFNFNPASIFMGDAGSLLLGFTIATMLILFGEVGGKWLLGGLVMFSLPVLDTLLAFTRRYVGGRPLFSADKHHFHHQMVSRGFSVRWTVLLSWAVTAFFTFSGVLLVFLRTRYLIAFYLVLFGWIAVAAYKVGMVHERLRREEEGEADSQLSAPSPRTATDERLEAPEREAERDVAAA